MLRIFRLQSKTARNFISFCIACIVFSLIANACRQRNRSSLSGIGGQESALLDLSKVNNPELLKNLCSANDLVVFIGNGEKFGTIGHDPAASVKISDKYLEDLRRHDAQKDAWYLAKIDAEYHALLNKMAIEDTACRQFVDIKPRVTVLAIIDGPGIGDSRAEATTFGRQNTKDSWRILEPTTSYSFAIGSGLNLNSAKTGFELLMPRDVPKIVEEYASKFAPKQVGQSLQFRFVLTILKGHGIEVSRMSTAMGFVGDIRGVFYTENAAVRDPISLLDAQSGDDVMNNKSAIISPIWRPEAICEMFSSNVGAPDPACVAKRYKLAESPFQVSEIGGCRQSALKRINGDNTDQKQGDEKQGDEKQGDEKQGDEKQGIFFEGLGGLENAEDPLSQGSKGVALLGGGAIDGSTAFFESQSDRNKYAPEVPGRFYPSAARLLGSGAWMGPGDFGKANLYPFRLPASTQANLVILDSCAMDPNKLDMSSWLTGKNGGQFGAVMLNPFPLSADALQYGTLSIAQYYFLLNTVLAETKSQELPYASQNLRNNNEDASRRRNLMKSMGPFSTDKAVMEQDVYCSMYAFPYVYDANNKSVLSPESPAINTHLDKPLCQSARWVYNDCAAPADSESVKVMREAVFSVEIMDQMLELLRAGKPVPDRLNEMLFGQLYYGNYYGVFAHKRMPFQKFGTLPDSLKYVRVNPTPPDYAHIIPEQLAVRQRYIETLQRLIRVVQLGGTPGVDPFEFALLEVAQLYMKCGEDQNYCAGWYNFDQALGWPNGTLGSQDHLSAGYDFLLKQGGSVPPRDQWINESRAKLTSLRNLESEASTPEGYRRLLQEILRVTQVK